MRKLLLTLFLLLCCNHKKTSHSCVILSLEGAKNPRLQGGRPFASLKVTPLRGVCNRALVTVFLSVACGEFPQKVSNPAPAPAPVLAPVSSDIYQKFH